MDNKFSRRMFAGLVISTIAVALVLPQLLASTTVQSRQVPSAVLRQKVDDSTGSVELVAAVAGKKIQIWGLLLSTASPTTMEFKSASTSLTGAMSISTILEDQPYGPANASAIPLFETAAGEAFNLVLGGAVKVTGQVTWTTNP